MYSQKEHLKRVMTIGSNHQTLQYDRFENQELTQSSHRTMPTRNFLKVQNHDMHETSTTSALFHKNHNNECSFNDLKTFQHGKSKDRIFSSYGISFANHSIEPMMRKPTNGFWDHLTPPATVSNSRSTILSCNSAPPFYTDYTHCASPALSEDFDRPYSSYSTFDNSDYFRSGSVCEDRFEIMKGCYTSEGSGVIYGQDNIYTAETVHNLVKNRRDGSKRRTVSNKVFVGGISHTMDRETINAFFARFGTVFVDWPVKGPRTNVRGKPAPIASYSYLFLVYFDEQSVLQLMKECENPADNEYYVNVPGYRGSPIQIRPWFIKNAFYISTKAFDKPVIDIHRTVFVGGLPRIVTAEGIAKMFSEFGRVLLVTIDIDQDYGYPKGAARVTFERDRSFNHALERKYLKFENIDSSKTTIEIKPYVMEDIGCDQCGGLWFNPFLEVYDQLKEFSQEKILTFDCTTTITDKVRTFDMWSCGHPFSASHLNAVSRTKSWPRNDSQTDEDAAKYENCKVSESEKLIDCEMNKNDVLVGSQKFLQRTKFFNLDRIQYVNVGEADYAIGPDLWSKFIVAPYFEKSSEIVHMDVESQIEVYLRLKRGNVYSNKSSYCKEKPCRQYYCPSCSNKLHSGPNQHILLPAGKPERRPRKDKNMYLVTQI